MNFQPLPDLRQVAIAELSLQIDQYFASGNTASKIPLGVSGETISRNLPRQQEKLRAQESGLTVGAKR